MQYFALLISQERDRTPDERASEMAAYEAFHTRWLRRSAAVTRCCRRRPPCASPAGPTRRSSPTARSPRPRRWPAATTCSKPKTWMGTGFRARHPRRQARRGGGLADVRQLPTDPAGRQPRSRRTAPNGRRWPHRTTNSWPQQAITSPAEPPCMNHPPRPPCGCVAARSSSPTGPTPRHRGGQRLLCAQRSRLGRGRQAPVDDPASARAPTSAGRYIRTVTICRWSTWPASSVANGVRPSPRSPAGPAT